MSTKITSLEEFSTNTENTIIGAPTAFDSSLIEFAGEDNIIVFEEGVSLSNTSIRFLGNNCLVYLSSNRHVTKIKLDIYNNSVFYLGKDANTTRPIHVIISEERHIFIGNDALFSRDIWFRNADPHLIYDADSGMRTNPAKSIYLGDHVWIAQNVMISKGTEIGSGSLVGAWTMTAGKKMESNSIYGGSPAKFIKGSIFWRKPSSHAYLAKQTKASSIYKGSEFCFKEDGKQLSFGEIENNLNKRKTAEERLQYLKDNVIQNTDKNRFFTKKHIKSRKTSNRIFDLFRTKKK